MEDKNAENKLYVREKVALYVLLFMLKVIRAHKFEHQIDELVKTIKEEIKIS